MSSDSVSWTCHGSIPGPASSELAKHRRTASGSDFSTYDIKHALGIVPEPPVAPLVGPAPPAPAPQHMPELSGLLDFSALATPQEIVARFELLAAELLHNHRIEVARGETRELLELLELEFYLYKAGVHEDPFTHASAEQSELGRWYFHRPPRRTNDPASQTASPMGYRGGTRKGVDLTIGRPPPAALSRFFPLAGAGALSAPESTADAQGALRGGILLRSIRRASDGKVVTGPSLLVDELLRLSGADEIAELVAVNWDGDIAALEPVPPPPPFARASTMWLRRVAPPPAPARVFRSPRIGLDMAHPSVAAPGASPALAHPRVAFLGAAYRFFVHPHLLPVSGRGQTFVGVYDALEARGNCADDEELVGELVRLTGVKGLTAGKYLAALRAGLQGTGGLEEWAGPRGKVVLSSVTAWLKMVGTMRRLRAEEVVNASSGAAWETGDGRGSVF
ncbi:hypothetical protein BC628DRAFT_1309312 [Trametes gibbosa]|nr:hypothetical protein BC628DRAFT_1309312 [Trametes gibbosa]